MGDALNSYLTPLIYEQAQQLGPPMLVSVGWCLLSFLCAVAVAYFDKKADIEDEKNHIRVVEIKSEEPKSESETE